MKMQTCFIRSILTLFKLLAHKQILHWIHAVTFINSIPSRKWKEDWKRKSFINFLNLVWEERKQTSLIAQTVDNLIDYLFIYLLLG
jgi:hypothetical protein